VPDVAEDTPYVFKTTDFPLTDPDTPANQLRTVTVVTLPSLGSLTLNNGTSDIPVNVGQVIQATDITGGKLKFLAAPNASTPTGQTSYTNFGFKIQDNGSTANGGVDT